MNEKNYEMNGLSGTPALHEWMKNLYTLLSQKTDPKAQRPNKMTSSETK